MAENNWAASGLLAAGLSVTSTATPALNGVYGTESATLDALHGEALSLALNSNVFVDGSTTVNWPDKSGAGHSFSEAQFKTLVNAIDLFVVQCLQYAAGIAGAPATTATIP